MATGESSALDAGIVARLVTRIPDDAGNERLLEAARRSPHRFLPTLASHWRRAGAPLAPDILSIVDEQMARQARYDEVESAIRLLAPDVRTLRGGLIRRLYPEFVVRQQNDVDLYCPTEATVWSAARVLVGRGWNVVSLWLATDGATKHLSVVFERGEPNPVLRTIDRVELLTRPLEGEYWRTRANGLTPDQVPELVYAAVSLLHEGVLRPFGCRDVYDLHLVLGAIVTAGLGAELADGVSAAALWPEWERLSRMVTLVGSRQPELLDLRRPATQRRFDPARGWLPWLRSPLLFCVLGSAHLLRTNGSALAGHMLTCLQGAFSARRLIARGIPMFSVPLDDVVAPGPHSTLHLDGPYAELRTPVGTFALSAGGDIPARWIPSRRTTDR